MAVRPVCDCGLNEVERLRAKLRTAAADLDNARVALEFAGEVAAADAARQAASAALDGAA